MEINLGARSKKKQYGGGGGGGVGYDGVKLREKSVYYIYIFFQRLNFQIVRICIVYLISTVYWVSHNIFGKDRRM